MGAFIDWLENSRIDEITKKTSADVKWKFDLEKVLVNFQYKTKTMKLSLMNLLKIIKKLLV
jgi:hypothetical protein